MTTSLLLAVVVGIPAQSKDVDRVKLNVNSTHAGGKVVIDLGTRHFVETGDRVVLRPLGGKELEGVVIEVLERNSLVQLRDKTALPDPGTRGEIFIPKKRGDTKTQPKPKTPDKPKTQDPEVKNKDEKWRADMPLLGFGRPVRPAERSSRVTGRVYAMGLYANTDRASDTDSFLRAGTDLEIENPLGRGGGFHFDAEYDYRTETNGKRGQDILVRGFSYYEGGSRFDGERVEIGRFLQRGVPELQVLDGVEWSKRRENGHRYGASVGWLPEPDEDYESLEDFQIAGHYMWVFGEREEVAAGFAYQKTWHNGRTDRDLLVAKMHYLPLDAWQFRSTMWIDYYDGSEVAQNSGLSVTQAFASLNRHWHNGDGVDLTWRRVRFADILRHEYLALLPQQLVDNRYDRLALTSWLSMTKHSRVRSELAFWDDEEDSGGSVEAGIETKSVFTPPDRLDVTVIGSLAQPSTQVGARVAYGVRGDRGSWDFGYEYGRHHFRGFPANRNELAQHLLRASRSFYSASDWDLTIQAAGVSYDGQFSWSVDFYLQKSF